MDVIIKEGNIHQIYTSIFINSISGIYGFIYSVSITVEIQAAVED